jgi:DNA (cytosine-5)-methyltransferase 1
MELTHGSFFAGVEGFGLGFERAGFRTIWQVENDDYATKVNEKNFKSARRIRDVRSEEILALERPTVITGGFPCQDVSCANQIESKGLDGERSGLWVQYVRGIRAIRPPFVVVENVAALYHRGLGRVLRDLAESGYDAEWDCLPAEAFGATHKRERVFIVAHSASLGLSSPEILCRAAHKGREAEQIPRSWRHKWPEPCAPTGIPIWDLLAPKRFRAPYGLPDGMDRLRCIGNAVYPDIAEFIAWRIREAIET